MSQPFITRRFFICFFFVSSLCLFLTPFYESQEVKIKIEAGVEVVYNPKSPVSLPDAPNELNLIEDLRLGEETEDENYMFSNLHSLRVDDEEDIIVLDNKEICLKVFDNSGKFLRKFGEKGQGPGEIQRPYSMYLAGGKDIAINDYRNNRFSYFSKFGECLKEVPKGKYRSFVTIPDSRGHIYGFTLILGDRVTQDLVKFDQDFKPVITIASFEMPKTPPPAELMEQYRFEVRNDDSLVWGRTYKYELNILDREGKVLRKIIKEYDPIKVTVEILKKEFKKRYPNRPLPTQVKKIPSHFPKHFPAFEYFVCDDEGRIYVRTYDRDGEDRFFFDVFDSEGRCFARFSHPDDEIFTVIKKNKVYCIIRANEAGIPVIKRYRMAWN